MPELEDIIKPEVHRLAARLTFDNFGLQPYRGLVAVFEPDLAGSQFCYAGEEYQLETNYWKGKIEDPDRPGDGMYEYKLSVFSDDGIEQQKADFTFRPGYPNAIHVETGKEIGSLPSSLPESIRVQVEATNLDRHEVMGLLRCLAKYIDLNPDYFRDPHEWSSIYSLETYVRIDRDIGAGQLAGDGGIVEDIALFSSGNGRGEWKWDHEEITGHYEAVALDPASWETLIETHGLAKRLKVYQPEHVRADTDAADPLVHHKLESQYWTGYYGDDDECLRWDDYHDAVQELRSTILNALTWAGVSLDPQAEAFVDDPYFDRDSVDAPIEIVPNPIPELEESQRATARETLLDPAASAAEWEVVKAMTDGGELHYEEAAAATGTSSSTVYRAAEQFSEILEVENGTLRWVDDVVRKEIETIVDRLESAKDSAFEAIRRTADRASILSHDDDGEPSPLEQWMNRHGIRARESYDGLEMQLDRPVSKMKLREILRAGLHAAERSGFLTAEFETATIDWTDLERHSHSNWQVVVDGEILIAGG